MHLSRVIVRSAAVLFLIGTSTASAEYFVTDLVGAAKRGDYHAVHRLIENGADLDARGPMGYTALHWAAIRGHWRIYSELVVAGAPPNATGSDEGTPLHWACHHDRADMVALLIRAGAEINRQNRWGRTPLHVAARRGCDGVASLLLEHGAEVDATTREGWTPLHVAYRSDHPAMVDLLRDRGTDTTLRDADGLTPEDSYRPRPEPIAIESSKLRDYEGIFDLGGGFTIKIWIEGDVLRVREFAPDDLYPIADDQFSTRQEPWRLIFKRGDDGRVASLEVQFLRRSVHATRTSSPRYVGSRVCMDCHSGADSGGQSVTWLRSRHAHAYWRLGADWALFLGRLRPQYQDLVSPIADERCLLCHVTGAQDDDALFAETFRSEEGIGCESCHGPGSDYIDPEIMADRDRFLANGGQVPDASTCQSCHRNSDRFDWDEWWPEIAHPKPRPGAVVPS